MTGSSSSSYIAIELDETFYTLLVVSVASALLTGSTLQWVGNSASGENAAARSNNRRKRQKWSDYVLLWRLDQQSLYFSLVVIAAISSLIQTFGCFINVLTAPDINLYYLIFLLVNWTIMTHSSVLLVSQKLALTVIKAEQKTLRRRLLYINLFMLPISVFISVYYATSNTHLNSTSQAYVNFQKMNTLVEPIQITLWGVIEFALSGAFIVQMWKYQWTRVERKSIGVLVLVGMCDTISVLLNLFIGDLESTCVKGLVYALRIRLEVSVLDEMVKYVRSRRNLRCPISGNVQECPSTEGGEGEGGEQDGLGSLKAVAKGGPKQLPLPLYKQALLHKNNNKDNNDESDTAGMSGSFSRVSQRPPVPPLNGNGGVSWADRVTGVDFPSNYSQIIRSETKSSTMTGQDSEIDVDAEFGVDSENAFWRGGDNNANSEVSSAPGDDEADLKGVAGTAGLYHRPIHLGVLPPEDNSNSSDDCTSKENGANKKEPYFFVV